MHWWLPNNEGYPPIIRSIRKFVEERTSPAVDLPGEDLRDMKAIFASLNLEDDSSSVPNNFDKGEARLAEGTVTYNSEWSNPALVGGDNMPVMGGRSLESDPYNFEYWGGEHGEPNPTRFP
jgi:hypothetical protein